MQTLRISAAVLAASLSSQAFAEEDMFSAFRACNAEATQQGLTGDARSAANKACVEQRAPKAVAQAEYNHAHQTPIMKLQAAGAMGSFEILNGWLAVELGRGVGDALQKVRDDKTALDDAVAPAVKYAKGKPDLIKAIKEYYAATSAFLDANIPINNFQKAQSDRLKSEMDVKSSALELELKLSK